MYDFEFYNPTRIIFGADKELLVGQELAAAGCRKVLLVYGQGSVEKSGVLGRVRQALTAAAVQVVEHGGVVSNPLLSHARTGVELAKANGVDGVLAVGGGSVIDEAKAIAAGACSDTDLWQFFLGKEVEEALPVYAILTLAATGSEMNGNAVLTNEETSQKYNISTPLVNPRFSILNPQLTHTVPLDYTAYGAVDVIAHVIEGYFTKEPGTRLQDRLVESIILTTMEAMDTLMAEPGQAEARASLMWAATLALNGLTPAGVGLYSFPNHMIEHSLSALYNIAHGAGLSIVMPAWMRWYQAHNPSQFERFAKVIFAKDDGLQGIAALERWFNSINSPTRLSQVGIPAEDIEAIAENAHGLARKWAIDVTYSKEVIAEILQLAV